MNTLGKHSSVFLNTLENFSSMYFKSLICCCILYPIFLFPKWLSSSNQPVLWTYLDYFPLFPWTHLDYCIHVPWTHFNHCTYVHWKRLKISIRVFWTHLKCFCPHACSGNTCKTAQACSENTFATFKHVQRTRLSGFQACSAKHLHSMKHFARWGLKF